MAVVEAPLGMPPAQKEIVDLLEEALACARSGEIIAIAIATVEQGRVINRCFEDGGDWARLVASVTALQHDLLTIPNEG